MKTMYFHAESRAVIDLDAVSDKQYYIPRINTPLFQRRRGYASMLLAQVCADADAEGVDLELHVVPTGRRGIDPGYDALIAWYERFGFREERAGIGHMFRRQP